MAQGTSVAPSRLLGAGSDSGQAGPGVGKDGLLQIRLSLQDGRTVLSDSFSLMPLKIARPFYLDDSGALCLFILNPTGGLVQGDRCRLEVSLEPGAKALITTQAATKIYRMEHGCATATELFRVGQGALLEYFPDPVIPFRGSSFEGETEIGLEDGSTALIGEVFYPGRARRGEYFECDHYYRRVKASYRGRMIYYDYMKLGPLEQACAPACFEGFTYYGQLLVFSERADAALSDLLHASLQGTPGLIGSASLTCRNGIVARILGDSPIKLARAVHGCWSLARRSLLGCRAPKLRKY